MSTIETSHSDAIHDCQSDYYGTCLATCSSDRTIIIREINTDGSAGAVQDTLQGHDGPVWMVAWAHPRFGTVLASAGYDARIVVWTRKGDPAKGARFEASFVSTAHTGSVNAISWCPQEVGLRLVSASSDGTVREVRCENGAWGESVVVGTHAMGVVSVSWASRPGSTSNLVASGGCDGRVKLWKNVDTDGNKWVALSEFVGKDWVRDVAFEPTNGRYLAAVSQDKLFRVFTVDEEKGFTGEPSENTLEDAAWRVSWSPQGMVAAVTTANSKVSFFRESSQSTEGSENASTWLVVNTVSL
eukprot:PhF_6_TR31750/c0_g1_i1/m.46744/K14004/SEC13; protein transport protein SEC13